ncbi:MAG: TIGR00269 family protein [Methanococci archaeon]|nr:TIGR00269 family protein [Methanococci archaeon]
MKCACGRESVYYQRYANRWLCEECFKRDVERRVRKALGKEVIKNNVRIGVGISGGKDSLVMTYILKKFYDSIPNSEIICFFVDEGIKGFRDVAKKYVVEFCKEFDIDLRIISFKDEINYTMDELVEKNYLKYLNVGKPCSFCGVVRRYLLNKYAFLNNCTYLAIGHNLDDFCQTILMNYIEGNVKNIIQFGKDVSSSTNFVKRIKPLKLIPEEEVILYAKLNNLKYQKEPCPYSHLSYRYKIKKIIEMLEEDKPGVRFGILRGYESLLKLIEYRENNLKKCKICGSLCSGELCKVCSWLEILKGL